MPQSQRSEQDDAQEGQREHRQKHGLRCARGRRRPGHERDCERREEKPLPRPNRLAGREFRPLAPQPMNGALEPAHGLAMSGLAKGLMVKGRTVDPPAPHRAQRGTHRKRGSVVGTTPAFNLDRPAPQ